jgi:hypothetical protein
VTLLPNSTSQQRWQQQKPSKKQQQQQQQAYNQAPSNSKQYNYHHQQSKKTSQHTSGSSTASSSTSLSSSTVVELPETFGLPSNHHKSASSVSVFLSNEERFSKNVDILVDDTVPLVSQPTSSSVKSPQLAQEPAKQVSDSAVSSTADIEIISETYPIHSSSTVLSSGFVHISFNFRVHQVEFLKA